MHVAEILFYNMYVPPDISYIVDAYYSTNQENNIKTAYKKDNKSNRRDILLNYLVNDDIQLSANSSYTTLNDFFSLGDLGNVIDTATVTEASLTGAIGQDHNNFRNIFNYSLWDKTDPMSISFKIVLYAKTDPLVDVVIPAYLMMSHASIDKIYDGETPQFHVPGISFNMAMALYNKEKNSARDLQGAIKIAGAGYRESFEESNEQVWVLKEYINGSATGNVKRFYKPTMSFNSKVLAFLIDGLVYVDIGMIKSISLTCSKHTATSRFMNDVRDDRVSSMFFDGNFPIWIELDVQLESARPAMSSMLWNSLNGLNIINNNAQDSINVETTTL